MKAWEIAACAAAVVAVGGGVAILAIDDDGGDGGDARGEVVRSDRPSTSTSTSTAPARPAAATPSDAAVETMLLAYARAYSSGDVDRVIALLTPDFRFQARGGEPVGLQQRRLVYEAQARRKATATVETPPESLTTSPGRATARVRYVIRHGVECDLCGDRAGVWTFTLRDEGGRLKIAGIEGQQTSP